MMPHSVPGAQVPHADSTLSGFVVGQGHAPQCQFRRLPQGSAYGLPQTCALAGAVAQHTDQRIAGGGAHPRVQQQRTPAGPGEDVQCPLPPAPAPAPAPAGMAHGNKVSSWAQVRRCGRDPWVRCWPGGNPFTATRNVLVLRIRFVGRLSVHKPQVQEPKEGEIIIIRIKSLTAIIDLRIWATPLPSAME